MNNQADTLFSCSNLSIGYASCKLLGPVNLQAKEGRLICLLGLNGMGKSTLIRTISGMHEPLSGSIHLSGKDLYASPASERAKLVSVILTGRPFVYDMTVREVLLLGRYPYMDVFASPDAEDLSIVESVIIMLNLGSLTDRSVRQLSDGELQRVMIGRVLCQQTPFIVMDEPTAFLDVRHRLALFSLLKEISVSQNKLILFSTHELDAALKYADTLWVINNHRDLQELITGQTSMDNLYKILGI